MKYLIIALAILLSGCGHNKDILVNPMYIDSALLQPCQSLTNSDVISVDDVLKENISLYGQYAICARKQDDSIKLIKSLANIKE